MHRTFQQLFLFWLFLLASLGALSLGCEASSSHDGVGTAADASATNTEATRTACPDGMHTYERGDDTFCIARRAVRPDAATETGFRCPEHLPVPFDGGFFAMCGEREPTPDDMRPGMALIGAEDACADLHYDGRKLDVLFVVDNSASMCEEQQSLANAAESLTERLAHIAPLDLRVAAVTTDVLSQRGSFYKATAETFPPPCLATVVKKCTSDAQCTQDTDDRPALPEAPEGSRWFCSWEGRPESTVVNPNGSINSRCMLTCRHTDACVTTFGSDYICKDFGLNITRPGCMVPPPEVEEPEEDFATVPADGDLGAAIALRLRPGADPSFNANLEQPLGAAVLALDRTGPNGKQAAAFLRDDAALLVVFVTDEDDCSLPRSCLYDEQGNPLTGDAINACIGRAEFNTCAHLPDGRLEAVDALAASLRVVKGPGAQVFVAAIAGDSTAPDPAAKQAERDAYTASETANAQFATMTYICEGVLGTADFGGRVHEFVGHFGDDGVYLNLCGGDRCETDDGQTGTRRLDGRCAPKASHPLDHMTDIVDRLSFFLVERVLGRCL